MPQAPTTNAKETPKGQTPIPMHRDRGLRSFPFSGLSFSFGFRISNFGFRVLVLWLFVFYLLQFFLHDDGFPALEASVQPGGFRGQAIALVEFAQRGVTLARVETDIPH